MSDLSPRARVRRSSTLDDLASARADAANASAVASNDDAPHAPPGPAGHGLRTSWLVGVLGVVLLVAGLALGIVSYDQRFIYENSDPIWDVVSWVGLILALVGTLAIPIAIVAALVVAIRRVLRSARRT